MAEVTGGEALNAHLKALTERYQTASKLKVGFLENAKYPDGTSVAMIALIQNDGAPSRGIPPRPFFTNLVKSGADAWAATLTAALAHVDAEHALKMTGKVMAGDLRKAIVDTTSPPNSPVTNLLKQRFPKGGQAFADVLKARHDVANGATAPAGKPLVQSGAMLAAVDSEVS